VKFDVQKIIGIAEDAGRAVMEVYSGTDFNTTYKEDRSPLTLADTASHKIITEQLKALDPALPVLSEESVAVPYEERRHWKAYWLVDPLDGTKEFIKRNGEFTVNISLIEDNAPVLGVVSAPSLGVTYYASSGEGAFKKEKDKGGVKIGVRQRREGGLRIVSSRSHGSEALARFLAKIGPAEHIGMGSSLKLCLVADGTAHLYPRFGPTMEWDTAAAQCIVEEAGGLVTDTSGKRLPYNKDDLHNSDFIVSCCEEIRLASLSACRLVSDTK
jgi:3'(2'), 5'-bisphosphate nucleotidase